MTDFGFVSDDFELRPSVANAVSHERGEQLRLKGTEYYFSIYLNESEYNHEKFWLEFSPGEAIFPITLHGRFAQ